MVNINFGIPKTSTLKQVRENVSHMRTEVNANDNANSIKALELRELIECKNGGPNIFKTLLRWCVVGPMYSQNKSESISCNKIKINYVVTWLPLNHYFTKS